MALIREEQLDRAEQLLDQMGTPVEEDMVKRIKTVDRGLIERTESSKVVLTEDNRQVLLG
jgi:hypothetical protein